MKNDSSRNTFDARKHFSGVRMQQGRAQLDADWNEQGDILTHRVETEALDIIGLCGGPLHYAAFHIVSDIDQLTDEEKNLPGNATPPEGFKVPDFLISAGRYYVDGILCENEQLTSYTRQPDLPDATLFENEGLYLIYVDVWQRHLTALDDPSIREIALGGPDTAARTKTVWQVKSWFAGKATQGNCLTKFEEYQKLIAPSDGKLSARTQKEKVSTDPCIVPPGAGYRGLENQFYRVEIHQGGPALDVTSGGAGTPATRVTNRTDQVKVSGGNWKAGQFVEIFSSKAGSDPMNGTLAYVTQFDPGTKTLTLNINVSKITLDELFLREVNATSTFKWSRDNGVVVTTIESIDGQEITVHDLGPDDVLGFKVGQWVEIIDDRLELNGLPGQLAQITNIETAINRITVNYPPTPLSPQKGGVDKTRHPKLRRWGGLGAVKFHPNAAEDHYLDLESGVQVRFFAGTFRTGDYWTIPARTATADTQSGNIEWPQVSNAPLALPPFGIQHHYCRLAMLHWDGKKFDVIEDCRNLFPPITELTSLFYVSGDGQEAMPNDPLPQLLQVGVFNGRWPVAGAHVRFIAQGNGRLAANIAGLATSNTNTLTVVTGADGIASCAWKLEPVVTTPSQQVEARLLDANQAPLPPVVRFNGNLSIADQVYYDPGACGTLQEQKTVQKALTRLSQLMSLYKISGDGQEVVPGETLALLVAQVASGCGPLVDQFVTFEIVGPGEGKVTDKDGTTPDADSIVITTNSDGIATCLWKPDSEHTFQEVEATITGDASHPTVPPTRVRFNATLSLASHVSYDPKNCPDLAAAGVETVQQALDSLCNIQPGGGCEVVVGKGGQYERLDVAIKDLLEKEHKDICICLLPGEHVLEESLFISDSDPRTSRTYVKIVGCGLGSRIILKDGQLIVGPLGSFTLRDVSFAATNDFRPIQFDGCEEIVIEGCYLYTSEIGGPADLITVSNASFIRCENNYFSSLWYNGLQVTTIKSLKIPVPDPFIPQNFGSIVKDVADHLLAAKPDVRKQFTDKYEDFLKSRPDLPREQRESISDAMKVVSAMGPGRTAENFVSVIEAVGVLLMGNALVLLDGDADTLIENNRFIGRIVLYGNQGAFSDANWKEFARAIQRGAITLTSPAAALQIRSNSLTGIYVDKSVAGRVVNQPNEERNVLPGLYGRCLFAENWCYLSIYQVLACHLDVMSNHFNYGQDEQFEVATVAARATIIVGNSAPNPASTLFFATIAAQTGLNLLDVRSL
jgi:hypothetical protein